MEKKNKIVISTCICIGFIVLIVVMLTLNSKSKSNLEINSAEELVNLVEKMYEGNEEIIPQSIQTHIIDTSDDVLVELVTGIQSGEKFEYLVVSEPMMSPIAYSLILAKVKDGVNAEEITEEMKNKNELNKWICVSAEQLYATNSGKVICLVMANKESADILYNKFKELAGTVGKEYEKVEEDIVLPPDLYINE